MGNKQKIMFYALFSPVSCRTTIVLFLNHNFLELKAWPQKCLHDIEADRDHMPFPTGIPDKNGAEITHLQYPIAFRSHLLHFPEKFFDVAMGKVIFNIFAIFNDIAIRRVSADQIDTFVLDKPKISGISYTDVNFAASFPFETCVMPGQFHSFRIDINAYALSIQEFGFDQRCPASCKLIKDRLAFFGVSQDNVPRNKGGPITPVFPAVGGQSPLSGKLHTVVVSKLKFSGSHR